MFLMSVSDVVFTMVPDVTNVALPYCVWPLDGQIHSWYAGPGGVWPSVRLLDAYDSTLESVSKISDELLFRC